MQIKTIDSITDIDFTAYIIPLSYITLTTGNELNEALSHPAYRYVLAASTTTASDLMFDQASIRSTSVRAFQLKADNPTSQLDTTHFKVRQKNYHQTVSSHDDYVIGLNEDYLIILPDGSMNIVKKNVFTQQYRSSVPSPPLSTILTDAIIADTTIEIEGIKNETIYA